MGMQRRPTVGVTCQEGLECQDGLSWPEPRGEGCTEYLNPSSGTSVL